MLLREDGESVICIGQASHAWLAGQLARAWGNPRFPPPVPREEVCLAAIQHDIGMAEWDLRPELDHSTGHPYSFMQMPLATHVALWSAAPAKVISQSHYAALLVSLHGTALYARRNLAELGPEERALATDYLDRQRLLQRRLIDRLGCSEEEVTRNQRLMWAWDSLSLAICLGWPTLTLEAVPAADVPTDIAVQVAGDEAWLDPSPLCGDPVELRCEARRLDGRFESQTALHDALAVAPLVTLTFTVSGRTDGAA